MNSKQFNFIILDASFISRLRRVDTSCELIEFIKECSESENCVVSSSQYQKSPCNHFEAPCKKLENIISDEEIIEIAHTQEKIDIDLAKIYRDPVDVRIFLWATKEERTKILTCDKNLLSLCNSYNIEHGCFKYSMKMLNTYLDGALFDDEEYKTDQMMNGEDPFFNFSTNTRCNSHCGNSASCPCHN